MCVCRGRPLIYRQINISTNAGRPESPDTSQAGSGCIELSVLQRALVRSLSHAPGVYPRLRIVNLRKSGKPGFKTRTLANTGRVRTFTIVHRAAPEPCVRDAHSAVT